MGMRGRLTAGEGICRQVGLGETEVAQNDVPCSIEKDVLWFEISAERGRVVSLGMCEQ